MAKNLVIPIERLEDPEEEPKQKLVNFYIEEQVYSEFEKLCLKEFKQKSVSKVLRKIIKEICQHYKR